MSRQFTTPIVLPGDPSSALQASTKQYVDNGLSGKAASTHTHAESDVTSLTTDLAAKAPTASPTFTGTVTVAKFVESPVALTDAATITVDASLGCYFKVTLGGNRTLGAPSNLTDGQMIRFQVKQDGTGGRSLSYASIYVWGADVQQPVLSVAAGAVDYLGGIYDSTANKIHMIAFARGY